MSRVFSLTGAVRVAYAAETMGKRPLARCFPVAIAVLLATSTPVGARTFLSPAPFADRFGASVAAVVSSSAAASPAAHKTALGYARASDLGLAASASFFGKSAKASTSYSM